MAVLGAIIPSGTVLVPRLFARICHSVNMEWGVKESHVALIDLHNLENPILTFQTFKTIENFAEYSFIGQLNIIRNSGGLKTGLGQDA